MRRGLNVSPVSARKPSVEFPAARLSSLVGTELPFFHTASEKVGTKHSEDSDFKNGSKKRLRLYYLRIQHTIQLVPIKLLVLFLLIGGLVVVYYPTWIRGSYYGRLSLFSKRKTSGRTYALGAFDDFEIQLPLSRPNNNTALFLPMVVNSPAQLDPYYLQRSKVKYYGDINVFMFEEPGTKRMIIHDRRLDEGKHDRLRPTDDTNDYYYNFDDDYMRNTYMGWSDEKLHKEKRCRRTNWHRISPVNCNTFHELDLSTVAHDGGLNHVGAGAYKHVFLAETPTESVVYKNFGIDAKYDMKNYERMRKDAIVAERVGPHPLIVDIYGYCGLGQLDEAMPNGNLEDLAVPTGGYCKHDFAVKMSDTKEPLKSYNNLLPSQKLQLSLEMFESVALLHNYKDGVIVHDDIQMVQFLLTPDKQHIRLNDFNRMEVMLWDDDAQEYCRYRNGPGNGSWRSPEEYKDLPLNEMIDIFSMGNNLYSILTGVYPFCDLTSSATKRKVVDREKPFFDPRWRQRSFAEGKIVELIELCQKYSPDDRIDSGAAVKFLREAVEENQRTHLHEDHAADTVP